MNLSCDSSFFYFPEIPNLRVSFGTCTLLVGNNLSCKAHLCILSIFVYVITSLVFLGCLGPLLTALLIKLVFLGPISEQSEFDQMVIFCPGGT